MVSDDVRKRSAVDVMIGQELGESFLGEINSSDLRFLFLERLYRGIALFF